ncbi:MAG: acylphosphatase [Candidatus Woesearchaeota archaeon]|nr:acylphosphatase [Candidatus Woesearchaeota archaeon]
MAKEICKRIRIFGYVQGVGFRWFIYKNAKELNLKGYVKNLNDGTVQAVICGNKDNVEKLIELCYKGPSYALVNGINIEDCDNENFDDFRIEL